MPQEAQLIFQCLFWVSLQTSTFVKFGLFAKGNTKKSDDRREMNCNDNCNIE